jgi:hypothetical protein
LINILFFEKVGLSKQIFQWFLTLMGKYSNIAAAALMALAMTGCASEGDQAGNTQPSSSPTPSSPPGSASQPFNNPVVAAKPGSESQDTIVGTPNLIQTTNATERLLVVSKGGNERDPFAQLTQSIPVVSSNTEERKSVPVVSGVPTPNSGNNSVNSGNSRTVVSSKSRPRSVVLTASTRTPYIPRSKATTVARVNRGGFTPVLPKIMPQVVPNTSLVAVLPPAIQPELAKGVLVTGVVMVGRTPQAIIKVPTDPTSRYVQAGDRLGGGLIVKRIEMNEGSDPIVIFEQFGIEVARMVGEGATTPSATAAVDGNNPTPATNTPTGA